MLIRQSEATNFCWVGTQGAVTPAASVDIATPTSTPGSVVAAADTCRVIQTFVFFLISNL